MGLNKAVLVLGDQLSLENPALAQAKKDNQPVFMVEALDESKVVWSHKVRTALFLSAMRHFAQALRDQKFKVHYSDWIQTGGLSLTEQVMKLCKQHEIKELALAEPGEWRLEQGLLKAAKEQGIALVMLPDDHFMCSRQDFADWAKRYKQLRMEYFYREMRKKHNVLMHDGEPTGGQWNFDASNRKSFPKEGPGDIEPPLWFKPDDITCEVLEQVQEQMPDHPGLLDHFAWPVTADQAEQALDHFIKHRLPNFGDFQDAMWTNTPFGWHSLISSCINLHLLDPRKAIDAAEKAYKKGHAPLEAVEGFIRQILGWREFMRGVYWYGMPKMREDNFLNAKRPLPEWFWTGQTQMACLQDCIGQTLDHGYAHHIQRLMVLGNFALLAGISPQEVEDWFLAVYVDAVEWVELPNVAGMALYANGGLFTSKPYIAGGAYINRMSNYCKGCQYKPSSKQGQDACPFTVLYWDFIHRHEKLLQSNPRTSLMVKNLQKMDADVREDLVSTAQKMLKNIESL